MNKIIYILFCILSITINAQNLEKVDEIVLNYSDFDSIEELTLKISNDFKTDIEKVRAVYTWITDNITYSRDALVAFTFTYQTEEEFSELQRLQKINTAKNTFKNKKAVCYGYTLLFNEMCRHLKIKSKYISGSARNMVSQIGEEFKLNHAWNIVEINNKEYLLDLTWGAGTYDNGKFNKNISYIYFLVSPEKFIKSHYPNNYENSLLDRKVSKSTFINSPITHMKNAANFELLSPKTGEINRKIKTNFIYKFYGEVVWVAYSFGSKVKEVKKIKKKNNTLTFHINSNKNQSHKLIIYINGKAINVFKLR